MFFLLLSVAYFAGFVFTDHVILGQDTGTDFHKGREPFLQKLADLAPANWTRYLGGTPVTGQRTSQYFHSKSSACLQPGTVFSAGATSSPCSWPAILCTCVSAGLV